MTEQAKTPSEPGPDYIVLRPSPDMPSDWMPRELDGKWLDRDTIAAGQGVGQGIAHPTGRFEVREDGAVAEVWEVRHTWASDAAQSPP